MSKKLVLTGGGSGGHTMPALAFIEYLQKHHELQPFNELMYIGSVKGIESQLIFAQTKVPYFAISTGKLRRYWSWENVRDIPRVLQGFWQSYLILKKQRPHLLISFGGFVSVPPTLAAFFLKIPVIIHEQTVNVGLANRINSFVAQKIAISFPSSAPYFPAAKTMLTGLPMRLSLLAGRRENLDQHFDFKNSLLPLLYITGGGQGSQPINEAVYKALPQLLQHFKIIHQTGEVGLAQAQQVRQTLNSELKHLYYCNDFFQKELPDILAATDILLGRSGAGIVNECLQLKIPALFIPLPFATKNEQYLNAQFLVEQHKAVILEQKNLTAASLETALLQLLQELPEIKKNYQQQIIPPVSQKLLELCLSVLRTAPLAN